jgi:para-nitrobenzyl esterase
MTLNLNRRHALAGGMGLTFASMIGCSPKPAESAALVEAGVVETPYGKLKGFEQDGVRIFRGVNYGADTSGKNRFMPPVKPDPWTGVKEATAYGLQAPQLRIAGQLTPKWLAFCFPPADGAATGENCLVLNVWTPGTDDKKRPVMVWFHGGGYTVGSSHGIAYDGASLARTHDVVVVGVNHRLHAFGFTDIGAVLGGDYARAGNVGIMDCVAALEWVRESIERFGGDPDRVMIFGESGGGAKVSNLLAMPSAKGLFHRAAIESGSAIHVGTRERTQPLAEAMLKELGVTKDNIGRLHELTTAEIEAAAMKVGATPLAQAFGPTNDGDVIVRHPFDPDAPDTSADVPIIVGYNRTEQTLFSPENDPVFNLDDKGLRPQFEKAMGKDTDKVLAAYKQKFPGATPSDLFFTIATETRFAPSARLLATRKAAKGAAPAHHYRFDWATASEGGKWRSPHTVEIPFVFNNMTGEAVEYSFGTDPSTRELARKVSGLWAAFAATGVPKVEGMPEWTPYDGETRPTMLFNVESKIENDPLGDLHKITPAIPSRF